MACLKAQRPRVGSFLQDSHIPTCRFCAQGSGLAMGDESTLNEMLKQKEELIRERDQQVSTLRCIHCSVLC